MSLYKEYQCPGCIKTDDDCYKKSSIGYGCANHIVGTYQSIVERIFLGLPTGFDRTGNIINFGMFIFDSFDNLEHEWGYDYLNIPCWKFLDGLGNTIVRGLSPRVNMPFLHVIKGDCRDKINCLEITQEQLDEMD